MNATTALDILDMQLEDLADLPEFVTPPAGAYRALILSYKLSDDKARLELKFKLLETLETSDPDATRVADGTEVNYSIMLGNNFTEGNLKMINTPIGVATGATTNRAVMEASAGLEVLILTTIRTVKDKTDSSIERQYFGIKSLEVI